MTGPSPEEAKSNARLIAAAPDLMEALCFLMLPSTEKALREAGFKTECDKARAAIAKAKGV